jgi:hypothetical protein
VKFRKARAVVPFLERCNRCLKTINKINSITKTADAPPTGGTTAHTTPMLQSEYNAIMRRKRLKVLLVILMTLMVALVLYAVIKVGKEKFMTSERKSNEDASHVNVNSPSGEQGGGDQSPDTSGNISTPLTPEEISAYENAAKEAEGVQKKVSAGTLSAEEARDRLREIGKSIPVPPLPPAMKK